jgi:hypothetical protein
MLGAAGTGVDEYILAELPEEQREAARRAVAEGKAANITQAVNYYMENPEYITAVAIDDLRKRRFAWWVFGGAALFCAGTWGFYFWKTRT